MKRGVGVYGMCYLLPTLHPASLLPPEDAKLGRRLALCAPRARLGHSSSEMQKLRARGLRELYGAQSAVSSSLGLT